MLVVGDHCLLGSSGYIRPNGEDAFVIDGRVTTVPDGDPALAVECGQSYASA